MSFIVAAAAGVNASFAVWAALTGGSPVIVAINAGVAVYCAILAKP
jgi:hypothetical protein